MYSQIDLESLATSLNLTYSDFNLISALSGALFGFTFLIIILIIISNLNIKG